MQDISLTKALSIARDIENGLIEKKFFEVFEGDPIELKQVLLDLAAATREHYNRIEKAWNEAKQLVCEREVNFLKNIFPAMKESSSSLRIDR